MGLDDRVVSERLTEMLSDTLQVWSCHNYGGTFRSHETTTTPHQYVTHVSFQPSNQSLMSPTLPPPRCPMACQGLIRNLDRICSSPLNKESIVLPAALVRALASSATASLLSHPDVAECVGFGRSGDGEEDDGNGGVATRPGGRLNHELGPVVAEVYCSFLSVSESGGCGAKNDQTRERIDAEEEPDALGAPGRERKQLSPFSPSPSSSSSLVHVRADKRLHFFRSFAELIHGTAEELVCGMGMSGWHYDDAVSRMTSDLWEIARCRLIPCSANDSKEGEEENLR